jgi:AcrR family transcriptional regulator
MATQSEPRPLRIDAERNLRRLLDAAAEAFAEEGIEVSVAEIARRAEVGKGTLFRRFPTKGHLIAALVVARFDELAADGRELLDAEDPGAAMHAFLRDGIRMQVADRGFCQAAGEVVGTFDNVNAAHDEVFDVTERLLVRAQKAGAMRKDINAFDILALQYACAQAGTVLQDVAPDIWERYVDVIVDGLRPNAAHPLSHPPLTQAQVEKLHAIKKKRQAASA